MQLLIINKTSIESIDLFNSEYGTKALSICPELGDITIIAMYHKDSQHLSEIKLNQNDAFAFYYYYKVPPKYAEIVIVEDVCKRLDFSNEDILAAIAHELGHIISIETRGDCYDNLVAEVLSDDYACKIGLRKQLICILQKMKNSGEYSDYQSQWIEKRIDFLVRFPTSDDLSTIAKMALAIG